MRHTVKSHRLQLLAGGIVASICLAPSLAYADSTATVSPTASSQGTSSISAKPSSQSTTTKPCPETKTSTAQVAPSLTSNAAPASSSTASTASTKAVNDSTATEDKVPMLAASLAAPANGTLPPVKPGCVSSLNQGSAEKAVAWIAEQVKTPNPKKAGLMADAVLAMSTVQSSTQNATELAAWLKGNHAPYTTDNPGGAAKVALALLAAGTASDDPAVQGLVDIVVAGVDGEGLVDGKDGNGFSQSLGILALAKAGRPVPQNMVDALRNAYQGSDGGFGYVETWNANKFAYDPDYTAIALTALRVVESTPSAKTQAAIDWAKANMQADGYWQNYSPANSTGLMAAALDDWGIPTPKSVEWLAGKQLGTGAWSNTIDGTESDLMATVQAVLAMSGASYASIGVDFCGASPSQQPSTPAPKPSTPAPKPSTPAPKPPVNTSRPTGNINPTGAPSAKPSTSAPAARPPAGVPKVLPKTGVATLGGGAVAVLGAVLLATRSLRKS